MYYKSPYYQMPLSNLIKCADCLDNPNTWQNSRACTYEYKMKDNSKDLLNVYSKQQSQQQQLYFINQNGNQYQVSKCQGCGQFCGNNTSLYGCNKLKQPNPDTLQSAFTCMLGYYYSSNKCQQCSSDLSCNRCQNSQNCDQCASGYALYKDYKCKQCNQITNGNAACSTCYFDDVNGNNYSDNPNQYAQNQNVALTMRCKVCSVYTSQTIGGQTQTILDITQMAIPSLDLTQCQQCSTLISFCIKCDYSQNQSQYIHSEEPKVIPTSQQSNFSLRCRRCMDGYYITPSFTCAPLDPIAHTNCMVPTQGDYTSLIQNIKYPTLNIEITGDQVLFIDQPVIPQPYPLSYVKYCAVCAKGFKANPAIKPYVCNVAVTPDDGCQNYSNDSCIACKNGYYLSSTLPKTCISTSPPNPQPNPAPSYSNVNGCGSYYNDGSQYNCLTCQADPSTQTGNYPDYQQRSCESCDSNCQLCTEFNTRFFFDDVKMLLFPKIGEDQQQFYKQTFKLQSTTWCKTCGGGGKINPLTGQCNGCSQTTCLMAPVSSCQYDQYGAFCLKTSLAISLNYRGNQRSTSQSLDRLGTVYCSDYQNSCVSITDSQKKALNPFLAQSSNYVDKILWTKANQCQSVNNVVYNSLIQRCLYCNTAGVVCRKKVTIQTFFDTIATSSNQSDSSSWSSYSSNLGTIPNNVVINTDVYLLTQLVTEGNSKVINLGKALGGSFDNLSLNYLKYSDEGVEEIEFQFIIVSTMSANAGVLNPVNLGLTLTITQNAFQMIPSLQKAKLTITTMQQGNYNSIGVNTLQIYLQDYIIADSFTSLQLNNINLSPLSDLNPFYGTNIFGIQLTNALLPITVTFNNCQIQTQQSLQSQKSQFVTQGVSSYFLLSAPNLKELDLNNFTLQQFYYPTGINWYYPGTQNNAILFNIQNSNFFQLSFSYVNVFAANNTNTQFTLNNVYLKQITLSSSNFICESSNLTSSNIILSLQTITFENIQMVDSFIINIMNAIRFIANQWTIKTPFTVTSSTEITAAFQSNLIVLNTFSVIVQQDNSHNPPASYKLTLNKASLFRTPPYSLNVLYSQQINHIYQQVTIDGAYCNLSSTTDQIQVTDCIFSLAAPYNNYGYLLNIVIDTLTIQNIKSSNQHDSNLTQMVSIKEVDSVSISNIFFLSNYNFDGMTIYNPNNLVINNFLCGENKNKNFQNAQSWIDNFTQSNLDSSNFIQGFCMNLFYCQENIVLKKLYLQNYVGQDKSPFYINCPSEIKLPSQSVAPVNIQDFTITNSIILLTNPNKQVAPIQFTSDYQFYIQINNIQINGSYLIPLTSIISMTFPSAAGIYLNSVSSTILVDQSTFQQTTSYKSQNCVYILCQTVTIQNSLFQSANIPDTAQSSVSQGGALYLSASQINVINCNFRNIQANQGGAIYINGLSTTNAYIQYSIFSTIQTPYLSKSDGQGGAIYIDARSTQFNLTVDTCTFSGIFARTMGGVIYMESGSRQSTVIITSSSLSNMYAPQGSLIYWITTNAASTVVLNNNNFLWDDQGQIDQQIQSIYSYYQDSKDFLLTQAWLQHSFIYMQKGSLTMNSNLFFGIKYQSLMILSEISKFSDTSSEINGYEMVTYPLILFDTPQYSISFTSTTINGVILCSSKMCDQGKFSFCSQVQNTPSALILTQNSGVQINYNNIMFSNNILQTNQGLLSFTLVGKGSLLVNGGTFINNYSKFGVINIQKQSSSSRRILSPITDPTVQIIGASFINNQGVNGTAINTLNSDLKIQACTFSGNVAQNYGGAIFFIGDISDQSSQLMFYGSSFLNNIARIGGAYYMQGVPIYEDPSSPLVMSNNQAQIYGKNNADYPRSLQLIYNGYILKYKNSQQTPVINISNYGSGQNPGSMVIQLLGSDGKIFYAENTYCTVALNYVSSTKPSTAQLVGTTRPIFSDVVKGFNITGINFILKPPDTLNLLITCDAIKNPSTSSSSNSYDTSYTFPLTITMRDCVVGEIYQPSSGQCYACPEGKYSLVYGAESCLTCPKVGVDKCEGYNNMIISAGYWRKNTSSDIIVQCSNLQSNCVGGSSNQTCYEGHIGALCEECDIDGTVWGKSWSHSSEYTCGLCSEISGNVLKIVAISLWTLFSIYLSVSSSKELVQYNITRNIFILLGAISAGKSTEKSNQTSVLIKILTSYFQIISVLFTFNLNTPAAFSNITNTVGNPSKQMGMSMDCFLITFSGNVPITYFSLIWMLVNPLLYIGLSVFIFLIYATVMFFKKKISEANKSVSYIWCTCIFLFITFQPSIVSAYISTASCRTIGDTDYIKANVSLECYSSQHISYLLKLILPVLTLWVFIIPLFFFVKLYYNRQSIYKSSSLKYAFGYLYQEYNPRAYLWEFVKMFEKIMIIIFINIYDSDVKVKGVLSFMCIIIYLILSYTFKPYHDIVLNRLDQLANEVCSISIIIGVFINNNSYSYLVYLGYILLIGFNTYFLVVIFRNLFKGFAQIIDKKFYENFDKIIKKLSSFPKIQAFLQRKIKKYVSPQRVQGLWKIINKRFKLWVKERENDLNAQFIANHNIYVKGLPQQKLIIEGLHSQSGFSAGEQPKQKYESPTPLLVDSIRASKVISPLQVIIRKNNEQLRKPSTFEQIFENDDYNLGNEPKQPTSHQEDNQQEDHFIQKE
ncbi:transmembrane protein, putative (macronuclear) [Tetrahymena thermophila SB210]|uniref:Transmembrane protein, putative n=1 Tax=Tetrahymena thermophila (strain SB210) TaxID=312017 RepID=I7MAF6_TETTS|nr:transmembrane protein, putative [Tetrahymena thermophila SB210]EAS04488.2 transmembrane protein, putative [Tetrahymena thermophila SB210]|eukprot:XP_001024733.2 transmembrane protein, putative [Tetrahymena thermophila SB210]